MPEMLLTQRGVVYPWQCDHMGHLNVMNYVGKFDEATWQMFAAIGLTPSYLHQHSFGIAATHQELTYRRELLPGDLITIRSAILEIRLLRIRFYHEMLNDESAEVAAATVITGVLLDIETRKPARVPAEVLRRGRELVMEVAILA